MASGATALLPKRVICTFHCWRTLSPKERSHNCMAPIAARMDFRSALCSSSINPESSPGAIARRSRSIPARTAFCRLSKIYPNKELSKQEESMATLKTPVTHEDHIQGPENAVTLVEYGDYECP